MTFSQSVIQDGMAIDWDVPIAMDDGVVLRADVFRPIGDGAWPVILSHGPYAKWLHFSDGYPTAWNRLIALHPEVTVGSSCRYQSWEVVDPEKWVPDGYACVRVDSRGTGRSPGFLEIGSPREIDDFYACIEWAADQPWSTGRVGLNGVSLYARNSWRVAARRPPALTAMCIWEGSADFYRDVSHHGGIYTTFLANWYEMQVRSVQYGLGARGHRSRMTGDWVSGPETLDDEMLAGNRADYGALALGHSLDDDHWKARSPDWATVEVPFLSAANWGGQGLHPRGNFEGFTQSASGEKWLEVHGGEHWTAFYSPRGEALQKRFFGYFLKDADNGWGEQSKVQLQVRHPGEKFVERHENEWPLKRTQWARFYLHPETSSLSVTPQKDNNQVTYGGFSDGVTFVTPALGDDMEVTGPIAARLWVSSQSDDADLFLVVRVFGPDMKELTFQGALDPHTPIAQGWLRCSHRKLDEDKTLPYRPYHAHDEKQPLEPDEVHEVNVEIWPTCIHVPKGYRIGLSVRGKDYVHPGGVAGELSNMKNPMTGCGPFLHNDPRDRPAETFSKNVTLHTGPDRQAFVMLPVIPRD